MIKKEIIRKICADTGYKKETVENVVNSLFYHISRALCTHETVVFRGFGTFGVKRMKPKKVRDVSSGRIILNPEYYMPYFLFSKDINR